MKVYSEKEKAEQGKLQNVNVAEKKSTRKWNGMELSSVLKDLKN